MGKKSPDVLTIMAIIFIPLGLMLMIPGIIAGVLTGELFFAIIFSVCGLPFVIVGIVFLAIRSNKRKLIAELKESGQRIYAKFDRVDLNYNIEINHAHPFIVYARYEDQMGTIHMYKSSNLNYDPTSYLEGKEIPIYVHPSNPKLYFMDVDSVMPTIEYH